MEKEEKKWIKNNPELATMKYITKDPRFWWNYLLLWLASRGILSIKMVNKLKWTIKKEK